MLNDAQAVTTHPPYCACPEGFHASTNPRNNACLRCGRLPKPELEPERLPVRSREWEQLFLDGAARSAGLAPDLWTPDVRDRMDAAERQYGNTWASRPLRELVAELDEEGMDLGGWSALIGQRLYADKDPQVIEAVLTRLREIAALGARERLLKVEVARLLEIA